MTTRAKMQVQTVIPHDPAQNRHYEEVKLSCVCGNQPFGPNGESEDNSFARWTPTGSMQMTVTNPALFGAFKPGQKFYVDLTPTE